MEYIESIRQISELPADVHWFCPRTNSSDHGLYLPEDIQLDPPKSGHVDSREQQSKLDLAKQRQDLALTCLKIFAFDGDDARPLQETVETRLRHQLSQCEICVREYHRSRSRLKDDLEREHDADEVLGFLQRLDDINRSRITQGLDHASKLLSGVAPAQRGIRSVPQAHLFAIFEALHCRPLLADEQFLSDHFDAPFSMIQANKRLKLTSYTPAMTEFLLSSNQARRSWAQLSWSKFKRNITATEYEWTVEHTLRPAMGRVQLSCLDKDFLPLFWDAVRHVSERLDADLFSHSFPTIDICKLALDHLQIDQDSFRDLLVTVDCVLRNSPDQFWQALSSTTAIIWVDQFKNSPALFRLLLLVKDESKAQLLDGLLRWTGPFVSSLKPAGQVRACRALLEMLFHDLQRDKYSRQVQTQCYLAGLHALTTLLRHLTLDKISTAARSAITECLDLVGKYAPKLAMFSTRLQSQLSGPAGEVIQLALALECQCLVCDRDLLADGRGFQQGGCSLHPDIWREAVRYAKKDSPALVCRILAGSQKLVGLEKFVVMHKNDKSSSLEHFNQTFDAINGYVADMMGNAAEFDSELASVAFDNTDKSNACLAQLFSSDSAVRAAAIELLKATSGTTVRREALRSLVDSERLADCLNAFSISLKRLTYMATFAPAHWLVKLCRDIFDALCDPSDGVLRGGSLSEPSKRAIVSFWESTWLELQTIFSFTETWSHMGHDKGVMMDFCRDVMEFAGVVFEQSPLFASALDSDPSTHSSKSQFPEAGKRLTELPRETLPVMLKFLRLRDESLLAKSTGLVCNVLLRLKQFNSTLDEPAMKVLEDILSGTTRTVLTASQKAELHRALETHLGKAVPLEGALPKQNKEKSTMRAGVINIDDWKAKARNAPPADTFQTTLTKAGSASEAFKKRQLASAVPPKKPAPAASAPAKPLIDPAQFARKRQEEIAAKRKRDAEAAAKARRGFSSNAVDASTAGQGSGLAQIGLAGKDHSVPKGEGVMVSSDESESDESETELDRELFGGPRKPKKTSTNDRLIEEDRARRRALAKQHQGPVKKQRLVRSAKDMRARLAPDLAPLHKILLGWDFNHDGGMPPGTDSNQYASVLSAFRDPSEYQNTFQPLLALEAWNGFLKAKEDNTARRFEFKVTTRTTVDSFLEVGCAVDVKAVKDVMEGDLVLLAKDNIANAISKVGDHCLSRVQRLTRRKADAEMLLRVVPGNSMAPLLKAKNQVFGLKIMSLIPLEREYGALLGLQYYDLCEEIVKAKPSPLLKYSDERLQPYMKSYNVNKAQAKAIRSAIDNDAFTLVQGPPGSGKTKTIVAIVGALLTDTLKQPLAPKAAVRSEFIANRPPSKKMLVCAPSNAAVDELIMRFKQGVKITSGEHRAVGIVRLGRSEAVNANVRDVALDHLVDKKLNIPSENAAREETQRLMREHKQISESLKAAQSESDRTKSAELAQNVTDLRRARGALSQRIDKAKDDENLQHRRADLNRRKAQQDVIEEAQIICATLSGSGHDMFQNLNVEFETVIIDEAAQCVELSALIPLKYGCAKCVLVGDPQQLPPTVFSREAANFKYEQSLFVRMQGNSPDHVHLLDTQYRMHPSISLFPSRTFYDCRLLDGPDMAKLRTRAWHAADLLGPFQFFDVQGQHQKGPRGHSLVNHAEINAAMGLYLRLKTDFKTLNFDGKIGIITPYKSQLMELKREFEGRFGPKIFEVIEFNTTDAFQGRESEIIIFSCVRASSSGGIGFLQDIRRMNVGLTRAKSSLWVLGNSQSLSQGEYWRKLLEHSKSTGCFFSGNIQGVLSRPLQISKTTKQLPDPEGEVTKPSTGADAASADAMEVDSASSRPSSRNGVAAIWKEIPPKPSNSEPVQSTTGTSRADNASPKSWLPAKRKLSDSRPSTSSSSVMSTSFEPGNISDAQPGSDAEMRDVSTPPSENAALNGDATTLADQSHNRHKKAQADGVGSVNGTSAVSGPRPAKALVRRRPKANIFATDPTKKRAPQ